MRMLLRDTLLCEDVAARYAAADAARYAAADAAVCEDVAARNAATDAAGVRMLLRHTVLRTLLCEDVAAR